MNENPIYTLKGLLFYFLKLGTVGFVGPVALGNYMHRDLDENKKRISKKDYKQGLVLAKLTSGPLAIYFGYSYCTNSYCGNFCFTLY